MHADLIRVATAVALMLTFAVGGCGNSPSGTAAGGSVASAGKGGKKTNVLLISVCSIRADHTSLYGYQRETTPNMTSFAQDAFVFDAAFAQWPKTAPAFASIVSGKYGHTTGVMRITPEQYLPPQHETLSEVLGAAGYETAAFLSSPALNDTTNIAQGHKVYEELNKMRGVDARIAPTTRALAFIKAQGDMPWFVWAHYNNAHYPYNGGGLNPETFVGDKFYDPSTKIKYYEKPGTALDVQVDEGHIAYHQITRADLGGVHSNAIPRGRDKAMIRPDEYAYYIARYDAGILGADQAVGRLLLGLREAGKFEDTLIVLVGDHGESLGEHNYYFEHGRFPYDNNSRVPFMVRPPGGVKSTRVSAPVAVFSAGATILDVLGMARPKDWEARSALPLARGEGGEPHVFTESGFQMDYQLAVRDANWKLIHIPNPMDRTMLNGVEWELYDWRSDTGEIRNVAQQNPDVVARLRGVLENWSSPWVKEAYAKAPRSKKRVDAKTTGQLQTLGYVSETAEEEEDAKPAVAPKRKPPALVVPLPAERGAASPQLPRPAAPIAAPASQPSSKPSGG
ncbi:MAG: sulfatase [Phycisphaerae bacterium]